MRSLILFVLAMTACTSSTKDPVDTGMDVDPGSLDQDSDGVIASRDCDDNDPEVFPGRPEVCDGKDNNCDAERLIDDADPDLADPDMVTYFQDRDGDGVGSELLGGFCEPPRNASAFDGDCDDLDNQVFPGNGEICNSLDDDCDGLVDDADPELDLGTARTYFADEDEDGFGDPLNQERTCVAPATGVWVTNSGDCDDGDAAIWTDAVEICDGIDNDCDSLVDGDDPDADLSTARTVFVDSDGDGFGDRERPREVCTATIPGLSPNRLDCDDRNPGVNPDATEICDGVDNNCDALELIDDDDPLVDLSAEPLSYQDRDRDGEGDPSTAFQLCDPPAVSVDNGDDCDDDDAMNFQGNIEVCDQQDNNCDGLVDDQDPTLVGGQFSTWFLDADGDGFGEPGTGVSGCLTVGNRVDNDDDCDDSDPDRYPGNAEVCDGIDNDCDSDVDDDDANLDRTTATWFFTDADGDGRGDSDSRQRTCEQPPNSVTNADDCDDSEAAAWTGAPEVCDDIDNDCDGDVDDADADVDASTGQTWYRDADSDGFGDPANAGVFCSRPSGVVSDNTDCNDGSDEAFPGAAEVCDGIDNDCDSSTDDDDADLVLASGQRFYADADNDGYGDDAQVVRACIAPVGTTDTPGDCNDAARLINPGAVEICDGRDNDCAGGIDDADPNLDPSSGTQVWADRDGDGYGDPAFSSAFCVPPAGAATQAGDCDDREPLSFPGNPEVCDGVDNDCNNAIDEDDPNLPPSAVGTWYPDADGDGFGRSAGAFQACDPGPDAANAGGDCNDNRDDMYPGAPEICDGRDNNCDGVGDVDNDTWWDARWPYRMMVTVSGAGTSAAALPVSAQVDFHQALTDLGDPSGLVPESVRVVRQSCSDGNPELPAEYMDDVANLFVGGDLADTLDDGVGTVLFLYDEDGNYSTRETLAAGGTETYGIYFASDATTSGVPAPNVSSTLQIRGGGSSPSISNVLSQATFSTVWGGLLESFGRRGSMSVASQTTNLLGNGMFLGNGTNGSWVSAATDNNASVEVLHDGPMLAALRVQGAANNAYGGFEYAYTYYMLEGRPELYVDTHLQMNSGSTIGPLGQFWGTAVRPFYFRNDHLVGLGPSVGAAQLPGYNWVRAEYDLANAGFGVAAGYVTPPMLASRPSFTAAGQWASLTGQDVVPVFPAGATTYEASASEVILEHPVIAVLPHQGSYTTVSGEFNAILQGVGVDVEAPESR